MFVLCVLGGKFADIISTEVKIAASPMANQIVLSFSPPSL